MNFHRFFIKYLNRYIHRNRTLKKFFNNSQLTNSINFNWKKNYTERVINKEQIARGIFIRFKKKGERKSLDRSGDRTETFQSVVLLARKKKAAWQPSSGTLTDRLAHEKKNIRHEVTLHPLFHPLSLQCMRIYVCARVVAFVITPFHG